MAKNTNIDFGLFESGQKNVENFQKYIKQNQQLFGEYCQRNQEILNEILELGFKYGSLWQEYISEQLRRLSNAKDLNDAIATEAGLTTEFSAKFNEANTRLYDLLSTSMTEQMKEMHLPAKLEDVMPYTSSDKKQPKKKTAGSKSTSGMH